MSEADVPASDQKADVSKADSLALGTNLISPCH